MVLLTKVSGVHISFPKLKSRPCEKFLSDFCTSDEGIVQKIWLMQLFPRTKSHMRQGTSVDVLSFNFWALQFLLNPLFTVRIFYRHHDGREEMN